MTTRIRCFATVLVFVGAFMFTLPAAGYEFYNGNNNCSQCHPGFEGGFGAALHDSHNTFVPSCNDCHVSIGDNPPISNCAGCHLPDPLWNRHYEAAPADQFGLVCSTCHTFVGNETMSWGETKDTFR